MAQAILIGIYRIVRAVIGLVGTADSEVLIAAGPRWAADVSQDWIRHNGSIISIRLALSQCVLRMYGGEYMANC